MGNPSNGSHADRGGVSDDARTLRRGITQSGVELFAAYGIDLIETPSEVPESQASDVVFFGLAGFGGPHLSGYVVLGTTERVLERSNRTVSTPVDWMAELANQFVGRIKNRLMREGVPIHRLPPAVVKGRGVSILCGRNDAQPIALRDHGDAVLIWIVSEPCADNELMPVTTNGETDALLEGDMVLF